VGMATWHLKSGPFTYAELKFEPSDMVFNVPADHR